nr:hypothetical protein Iba_chr04aCG2140 [Ipomoea batatas]GMC83581.1 hypothetical protein Iba_chr04cCG3420 [Ipomoea batatas]GMD31546.1 hypothetical protein Iba_scaffold85002CG0010 [Ipomoea batatas]
MSTHSYSVNTSWTLQLDLQQTKVSNHLQPQLVRTLSILLCPDEEQPCHDPHCRLGLDKICW